MSYQDVRKLSSFRRFTSFGLEAIYVLVAVAAAFILYLNFLELIFPQATNLNQMIDGVGLFKKETARRHEQIFVKSGDEISDIQKPSNLVALISGIENRVKHKTADSIAWHEATNGLQLYDRDAVQTLSNSTAVIEFDRINKIDLGENTLIIIKKFNKDRILSQKRSTLMVLSGELYGTLQQSIEKFQVNLSMPGGSAKLRSRNQGRTEYKVNVHSKKSATLTMFSGSAEVSTEKGVVNVNANHALKVEQDKPLGQPIRIPGPTTLKKPNNKAAIFFNKKRPIVDFRWVEDPDASKYKLLIARDKSFRKLLLEKTVKGVAYRHRMRSEGKYYWKVSALKNGYEGAFSDVRRLDVIKDTTPPSVTLKMGAKTVDSETYPISGQVKGASRLIINGKRVKFDSKGNFSHKLQLKRGVNVIIVEAVDAAGNVDYQSKIVKRK